MMCHLFSTKTSYNSA
uniref:Uncharacterized protein n=1 Tax=Arundo donax TaxID=35708 RepID=A0A0A9CLL4_ARUDO